MAPKKTLIERMRANPKADWTIQDVETLARQEGLKVRNPTGGSHYAVYSDELRDPAIVPARRPIKPFYIRMLVGYVDAHRAVLKRKEKDDD
ncbi:MAG: hypothetical protein ACXIUV_12640 [Alkalilacustris sp.]